MKKYLLLRGLIALFVVARLTGIAWSQFAFEASYGIVKEGDTVYARNGRTGAVEFSGTDASTAINSVISALPGGGNIFIKAGTYIISSPIAIGSNHIALEGEGCSTVLEKGGNCDVIRIEGDGVNGVQIMSLMIEGKGYNPVIYTGGGIYINTEHPEPAGDSGHLVEYVEVKNTNGDSIRVDGDSGGVSLVKVIASRTHNNAFNLGGSDHQIDGCIAYECRKHGYRINSRNNQLVNCKAFWCGTDSSGDSYGFCLNDARNNHLVGCQAQDNFGHGLVLENGSKDNAIDACVFDSNGQGAGVAGSGLVIRDPGTGFNTIVASTFSDRRDPHVQDYGVEILGEAANNVIVGCTFAENQYAPFTGTIGTNVVENNAGLDAGSITPTPSATATPTPSVTPTPTPSTTPTTIPSPSLTPRAALAAGRLVVAADDYDGNGASDPALFRNADGSWRVRGVTLTYYGTSGDIPVPGDYNADGIADVAVFRPSTGKWYLRNPLGGSLWNDGFGLTGDVPVPADYDGDFWTDTAVFRPEGGGWYVRGLTRFSYGLAGDIPLPGDYDGDGTAEASVLRAAGRSSTWFVRNLTRVFYGLPGDIPVPGDYEGDGITRMSVFRPSSGRWYIRGGAASSFGTSGDIPFPLDFDGDGTADRALFRPSAGRWYIYNLTGVGYGTSGDQPAVGEPY